MATDHSGRRNSNTQLLEELEALSQSLYQSHTSTTRRTASLVLPRTSVPPISSPAEIGSSKNEENLNPKPRSRRMSLSPWRSRTKEDESSHQQKEQAKVPSQRDFKLEEKTATYLERKGLWNWKPIRALTHIGMQKLSCLFSVEVVAVQGLPASMNGLRLSVYIRKQETKDGAVQTMPSRVSQGAADFEETLFIRCHVYYSQGSGSRFKFEPRPFLIYAFAIDAEELDFGKNIVDLSFLIRESIEKNQEGTRIRQWDTSFKMSGKAKGGELVLKLGFQVMEKDGGVGIYSQPEGQKSGKSREISSMLGRRQSKTSFSVPSPRMSSRTEAWTPSQVGGAADLLGIDDLDLDEPAPPAPNPPEVQKTEEPETKMDDMDIPEFDVVDKGVEILDKHDKERSEENSDKRSVSSEDVKEIVHGQAHSTRLTELDSIAQQIKALESIMGEEAVEKADEEIEPQRLDAEEEMVTREFLQMLENEEAYEDTFDFHKLPSLKPEGPDYSKEEESEVFIPDLGKNLGCVIQTKNGGYLAAMNPLNNAMARKDTPKLAMQLSKPMVLPMDNAMTGFELFQKMAGVGIEQLSSEISSLMPIEEVKGKTAEQIAFEGIASAIIQGRNKEGATSSAARSIGAVKSMITAMGFGRKERISTGIWILPEDPLTVDEILSFSMQKIEVMAVEALKIQADMAEEDAPFDVSPLRTKTSTGNPESKNHPLASAVSLENWIKDGNVAASEYEAENPETITLSVVVQLRDPLRLYETVGGLMIVLIHATYVNDKTESNEEKRFKVASLHVGGIKLNKQENRSSWDIEKQKLSAMQWLVAYGLGKGGKKAKVVVQRGQDILWSISSRVMAGMWLKPMRNPNVKFTK